MSSIIKYIEKDITAHNTKCTKEQLLYLNAITDDKLKEEEVNIKQHNLVEVLKLKKDRGLYIFINNQGKTIIINNKKLSEEDLYNKYNFNFNKLVAILSNSLNIFKAKAGVKHLLKYSKYTPNLRNPKAKYF